ncbi:MAG: sulfite exporter TauE/SafE family protein [Lachnospiraceae bacterium]|nr:sulfite exporter TauE/SafE family protein [Lachnospiraceae bacterium]
MESAAWIAIPAVAFVAGLVQASCGIGFAIIVMSLWPLWIPFRVASAIEHVAAMLVSGYLVIRLFPHIRWKLILPCLASGLVCSFLGVRMMLTFSETFLHKILGITLLLLTAWFLFFSKKVKLRPSVTTGLAVGCVTGFAGGIFNIGGPPMAAYLLSVSDDKNAYSASVQAYFLIAGTVALVSHLTAGTFTADMLPAGSFALAGTFAGMLLGFILFRRLTLPKIKTLLYVFMATAGVLLLLFG